MKTSNAQRRIRAKINAPRDRMIKARSQPKKLAKKRYWRISISLRNFKNAIEKANSQETENAVQKVQQLTFQTA